VSAAPIIQPVTLAADQCDRSYDIIIGQGTLAQAGDAIKQRLGCRRCVIVSDRNVAAHYGTPLQASLVAAGHHVFEPITISAGESSKNFVTLELILDQLLARRIDRNSVIIALGGGVVGDIAGLAAALALRGVPYVQIPTTLLAQVDSSVGGKTAIDHRLGKNMIGAFYQPQLVVIDAASLQTLPRRELQAGYAEIVKYGLINDVTFFDWCEKNGSLLLDGDTEKRLYAIHTSCAAKAAIVAADERETGQRALLNLGHTFGHALESALGFNDTLLHGEAVAIGCVLASKLSVALGLCQADVTARIAAHFAACGLPIRPPRHNYNIDQLMQLMAQDKKAMDSTLTLILLRGIGQAFVTKNVDASAIREIWQAVI
jgi:3-dehydroquinate synthase